MWRWPACRTESRCRIQILLRNRREHLGGNFGKENNSLYKLLFFIYIKQRIVWKIIMHTNKIISFSLILISSLLYGCFGSSGVLPIGQGVYSLTVETPYIVGASGTKKKAIEEAQAYCVKQGKEVNILQYRGSSPAQNVFDMTFECLAPGEKSDTQVKPSPDAVIEVHNY